MMGQVRETLPVCEKANNKYKSDLPIFRSVVTIKLQKCTVQDDIFNCTKSVGQIVFVLKQVTVHYCNGKNPSKLLQKTGNKSMFQGDIATISCASHSGEPSPPTSILFAAFWNASCLFLTSGINSMNSSDYKETTKG